MIEELLTALIVGLLVAFALQVLLTLLGVAIALRCGARVAGKPIGMSVVAIRANSGLPEGDGVSLEDSELEDSELRERSKTSPEILTETAEQIGQESSGSTAKLGFWTGFGVLLMVNTVLFAACFLASRFSLAQSPIVGAIEGIVIWAAYLLILIWLSSTAVSSVVGSLLSITTGGFRNLLRPVKSLFATDNSFGEPQAMTAAEMQAAVRQEVQTAFDPERLQHLIRTELQQLPLWKIGEQSGISATLDKTDDRNANNASDEFQPSEPSPQERIHFTLATLQQQLVTFLQQSDKLTPKRVDRRLRLILEAAQAGLPEGVLLPDLDRSLVLHLLIQRKDLSEKQRGKIFNQLQETWSEVRESRQTIAAIQDSSRQDLPAADEPTPAIQQFTETALKTLVDQLPNGLRENVDLDRLTQQLPELLQQAGTQLPAGLSTGAGLAMLTMALVKGKDLLPENGIDLHGVDLQQMRQSLDRLVDQSGIAEVGQGVMEQVDQLRDRSMEQVGQKIGQQIEQVQQTVQEQVSQIKTQTSETVQKTQRAATIAAWWLFLTVLTGAISSAVAGAAANLVFTQF
ncbi:hypothetical protein [Leptolyngbya ohadii]|uniref:hypothetical protein n=1 Tax=Leptolyngbya ohadii TaxID=1962290 RepID=UPI00117B722C|nr:hypothetical protein [Leptolyngbya ohadii]